jgi:hypothetical protein
LTHKMYSKFINNIIKLLKYDASGMFICQSAQSSQYDKLIPGICQLTANFETLLIFVIYEATLNKKPDFFIRVRIRIRILGSVLWFTNPGPALFGNGFE